MLSKVKAVHLLGTLLAILSLSQVCDSITHADAKALRHHLLDTLAFVHPSNKTNFKKLCLSHQFCSRKSFAPIPGFFHWRDGTTEAEKEGFWQTYKCVMRANIKLCPIDGHWSVWAEWSACSVPCQGVGNRTRTRQCNNPLPANRGLQCFGRPVDRETCSGTCNNSALANGLQEAREHLEEVHKALPQLRIECLIGHCTYNKLKNFLKPSTRDKYWSHLICYKYKRACPVDGDWSTWGTWSECTVPCGNGYLYRQRVCNSPSPINGGQTCPGQAYEKKACVGKKCSHITGNEKAVFSEWSKFSPCSVSCGSYGSQVTSRSCLLKGKCLVRGVTVDNLIISRPCFQGACPKKGGWSDWSEWTGCSAVCGEGRKTRLRMCADPYPSGGEGCLGPEVDTSDCNRSQNTTSSTPSPLAGLLTPTIETALKKKAAPAKPAWGDPYHRPYDRSREALYKKWGAWSGCSRSCGGGYRKRVRVCVPSTNATCCGEIRQVQFCNVAMCPVNGGWSDWMQWSTCDVTCGTGSRRRYRLCDKPLPSNGGACMGLDSSTKVCKNAPCKDPDNRWSHWSVWSSCDKTCGQGQIKRVRQWKGDGKKKSQTMKGLCNIHPCPVAGNWAAWGQWAPCSKKCGLGHNFRDRTCTDPAPFNNGPICPGPGTESVYCYNQPCQGSVPSVKFNNKSYLTYSPLSKPIRYLLMYLRLKPLSPSGTLIYRHRACVEGTWDCSHFLVLTLVNYLPTLKVSIDGRETNLVAQTSLKASEWNDILVYVSRGQSYIRVNDGVHARYIPDPPYLEEMNLDASMRVGICDNDKNGFHGMMSILRINFKDIVLYQSPDWIGLGAPDKEILIEKQEPDSDVNYPDFRSRHYARLSFRHDQTLKVLLTVRMRKSNGLILYNEGVVPGSHVALFAEQGALKVCFACNQKNVICEKTFVFQTRSWYYLSLEVEGNGSILRMDKGKAMQLSCIGRNYRPQKEVFIGGAPPSMWTVITNSTGATKGHDGNVDEVVVNDEKFSFRFGALFDTAGTMNSMGYSLSAHVSNVVEHLTSRVTLRCDFTSFTKGGHHAKAEWLLGDSLLKSSTGAFIMQWLPGLQDESSVTLMPNNHKQGLYACVVNQDGRLKITHAFSLTRSDDSIVLQVTPEWTIIIVLTAVVLFIFIATAIVVRKSSIKNMAKGYADAKAKILEDIKSSLNKPDLMELGDIPEEDEDEDASMVSAMEEDASMVSAMEDPADDEDGEMYDVNDIDFGDDEEQDVDTNKRLHQLGSQVAARLIKENKDQVLELISSMMSLDDLGEAPSPPHQDVNSGQIRVPSETHRQIPAVPEPGSSTFYDINTSALRHSSSSQVQMRSSPSPTRMSPGHMIDGDRDMSPERRWSMSHRSSGTLSPSRRTSSRSPRRLSRSISPPKASGEYVNNVRPLRSPRYRRTSPPLESSDGDEFSDPHNQSLGHSDPHVQSFEHSDPPLPAPPVPDQSLLPPGIPGPSTPPGFGSFRQLPVVNQRGATLPETCTPPPRPPSPPEVPPPQL